MSSPITNNSSWVDNPAISCVVNIGSAGTAIVPTGAGFVMKSLQQIHGNQQKFPFQTVKDFLLPGVKAAPTIGCIIGVQIVAQNTFEKQFAHYFMAQEHQTAQLLNTIVTSCGVGLVSSYPLAVFNGQSTGLSIIEAMKSFSPKIMGLIGARECSFLCAITLSDPLIKLLNSEYGETAYVKYGTIIGSSILGSACGQGFDTMLTCAQQKIEAPSLIECWKRGLRTRGCAVVAFSVLFHEVKDVVTTGIQYLEKK